MNDTKRSDGGSAFPQLTNDYIDRAGSFVSGVSGGMSLRDYFAGQALPSVVSATCAGQHNPGGNGDAARRRAMADDAYSLADAMLAAREASR